MDLTMDPKSKTVMRNDSSGQKEDTDAAKAPAKDSPICLFCKAPLSQTVVDLGMSPLCESYLSASQLNQMEPFYPLHVRVCGHCFLVQLEAVRESGEIFTDYAYFSSYSDSLAHPRQGVHRNR